MKSLSKLLLVGNRCLNRNGDCVPTRHTNCILSFGGQDARLNLVLYSLKELPMISLQHPKNRIHIVWMSIVGAVAAIAVVFAATRVAGSTEHEAMWATHGQVAQNVTS
jgi:hypothetical protein